MDNVVGLSLTSLKLVLRNTQSPKRNIFAVHDSHFL
jgi:hypothetical protein